MKRTIVVLIFLALGFQSHLVLAQAVCPKDPICESRCRSQAKVCDATPPAGLVSEVGPEPPRTVKVSSMVEANAWTTLNMDGSGVSLGWTKTQKEAADQAASNAESKLIRMCSEKNGSLGKVDRNGQSVCKTANHKFGPNSEATVYNCLVGVRADCSDEKPNPNHAAWTTLKAASDEEARRLATRKSEFDSCHTAREAQIRSCSQGCTCEAGASSGGSTSGKGTPDGPQPTKIQGTVDTSLPAWKQQQLAELQESQVRLQKNSAELADMVSKVPPKTALMGIGLGLGAPLVIRAFASNATVISTLLLPTMVTVMGVLPSLAYLGNKGDHATMRENYQPAIAAASTRCEAGELASCYEANELVDAVHDAGQSGGQRRQDLLSLGPRWQGPTFAVRYTAAFFSESAAQGPLAGDHTGGSTRSMIRVGMGLFGLEMGYRNISYEGEDRSGTTGAGLVGLQAGSGLASPYALMAARGHYFGDSSDTLDVTLELGNTFDLTPIFSTAGPFVVAPTIDVAVTLPTSGDLEPGYRIGLGMNTARFWPEKVEDYTLSTSDRPARGRHYMDVAMPFLLLNGGGLQIARFNGKMGKSGTARSILVGVEGWVTSKDDGISGGGSLASLGLRGTTDNRQFEWGFVTGLLGVEAHSIGSAIIGGALPTKLFVRYTNLPINVELGAMMPLLWANLGVGDGESFALYESLPLQGYLGLGFPMAMPDNL